MRLPSVSRSLQVWISHIQALLNAKGIILQACVELFLQPDKDDQSCGYYFVDHARAVLFWIDSTTTLDQDLPPATSLTHLSKRPIQYPSHIV